MRLNFDLIRTCLSSRLVSCLWFLWSLAVKATCGATTAHPPVKPTYACIIVVVAMIDVVLVIVVVEDVKNRKRKKRSKSNFWAKLANR